MTGEKESEAAQRGETEKVLHLLNRGDYVKALDLADATYRRWRDHYSGRPPPEIGATRIGRPRLDACEPYVRSPSLSALTGAQKLADAISKIRDPHAIKPLLAMRTPEICLYAYAAAMEIGAQLCEEGRLTDGFSTYHGAMTAWEGRKIEPNTREWVFSPLLGERSQPQLWDRISAALAAGTIEELIKAYRTVRSDSKDDLHWATLILRDVTKADLNRPSEDKFIAFFAEVLRDKRASLRKKAARLVHGRHSRFSDWRTIGQMLAPHLDDPDPDVRFFVANSMVHWGDSRGLAVLLAQLPPKDLQPFEDPPLRTLGELGMRQATPWMIELATQYPAFKLECVRSLGVMEDPNAIDFLGKILLDRTEPALTRSLAANALGRTMDDAAFPYLKKALATADAELANAILSSLNGINPKLAMPVWTESMKNMGLLDKPDLSGRDLGAAWLQLHLYSGYPDVIAQHRQDPRKLLTGMDQYWQGRRKLQELSARIRRDRFAKPAPEKENAAWRELAEVVKHVPERSFDGSFKLGPPDAKDGIPCVSLNNLFSPSIPQGGVFHYISRDGTLLIEQRFIKDHLFVIDVSARKAIAGAVGSMNLR